MAAPTNMKTIPYRRTWGNAKMKGLKECGLSCRCCVIFNDTEKRLLRHIDRETTENFNTKSIFINDVIGYDLRSDYDNDYVRHDEYYYTTYKETNGLPQEY